jgi:hypothetical protein
MIHENEAVFVTVAIRLPIYIGFANATAVKFVAFEFVAEIPLY